MSGRFIVDLKFQKFLKQQIGGDTVGFKGCHSAVAKI